MLKELYKTVKAKQRLKDLAKSKYHHLAYEVTETASGCLKVRCNVYVEGYGFFSADTWDRAIEKLKKWMEVKPCE